MNTPTPSTAVPIISMSCRKFSMVMLWPKGHSGWPSSTKPRVRARISTKGLLPCRLLHGQKSVLISGAGIAGPALAYWLQHRGFEPLLIEQAAHFRKGGYMIDFWGIGFEVAERMNLIPHLRDIGYLVDRVKFVNHCGCDDLYFDSISQVRMPAWSKGRIGLVGDAAYCPSLLAGEGAGFALAGAYLLAGELQRASGDHLTAFRAYEQRFRPFI